MASLPAVGIGLVAFDLDGTLLRGETCVEAVARTVGRSTECVAFEALDMRDREAISAAREQMAEWYRGYPTDALCADLTELTLAPGARDAFALLRSRGITTAIVSITWQFAVDWFGRQFGADYTIGTRLTASGSIEHFWPEDKGRWLDDLCSQLDLTHAEAAAVGDSDGDLELLEAAGTRFFVGATPPPTDGVVHLPQGDTCEIARAIVAPRL
jgi:HAD superfamily phosphoserine phosphatase-like hydrolase